MKVRGSGSIRGPDIQAFPLSRSSTRPETIMVGKTQVRLETAEASQFSPGSPENSRRAMVRSVPGHAFLRRPGPPFASGHWSKHTPCFVTL